MSRFPGGPGGAGALPRVPPLFRHARMENMIFSKAVGLICERLAVLADPHDPGEVRSPVDVLLSGALGSNSCCAVSKTIAQTNV